MTGPRFRTLSLGTDRFDRNTNRLSDALGARITMSPEAIAILTALIERPGEAVGKDALASAASATTDEDLVETVAEIRHAIGDSGQTIIQTVPGVGYRLNTALQDRAPGKGNTLRYIGLAVAVLPVIAIIAFVMLSALDG